MGLDRLKAGAELKARDVLADALSVPILGWGVPGDGELSALLDQLETLVDIPELSREVLAANKLLANAKGQDNAPMLQSRVERLLRDPRPNRSLIAIELLSYSWRPDFSSVEEQIRALTRHSNPGVRQKASYILEQYAIRQR